MANEFPMRESFIGKLGIDGRKYAVEPPKYFNDTTIKIGSREIFDSVEILATKHHHIITLSLRFRIVPSP